MGTLDSIYVLNYVANRQISRKWGKLIVLFIDLRAAFNSVDKGGLIGTMRKKGIREGLIRRVEKVLMETKSRVRVGGELGRSFWTTRGVRQGCPLSPLLFNIMLADIEEKMGKVKWRGGEHKREENIFLGLRIRPGVDGGGRG